MEQHKLVVNREGLSGNVRVTTERRPNNNALEFKIKANDSHHPNSTEDDTFKVPPTDEDDDNELSEQYAENPAFIDELANPAKKGAYTPKEFPYSDMSLSDASRGRRGRTSRRHKRGDRRRSSSLSPAPKPSAGFSSIKEERLHICLALKRLRDEGVTGIVNFDESTDIEELRMELKAIEQDELVRSGIMNCRSALVTISAGIEIVNKRFNPFDLELNGWSQHLFESIETFDGVFERLTKKYSRRVSAIAPEAQLLIMLAGNAFSYCFMRSMIRACEPSMSKVAEQNPELVRQMMNSIAQQQQPAPAQQAPVHNPVPGPHTVPAFSSRGKEPKSTDAPATRIVASSEQRPPLLKTQDAAEAPPEPPVMVGPDKQTLEALIARAQRIATEASSDSSLLSVVTGSISMSATDTIESALPSDQKRKKVPNKQRSSSKKSAANVIDI